MDTAILAFASPDRFLPKRKTQAAVAALETIPCNLCINPPRGRCRIKEFAIGSLRNDGNTRAIYLTPRTMCSGSKSVSIAMVQAVTRLPRCVPAHW